MVDRWIIPLVLGFLLGAVGVSLWWSSQPAVDVSYWCAGHVEGVGLQWLTARGTPLEEWPLTVTSEMLAMAAADCEDKFADPLYVARYPFAGPRP